MYNAVANSRMKPNDRNLFTNIQNGQFGGYIVCNKLAGQQASSMLALISLQCWAKLFSLPMKMVEPFVEGRTSSMLPKGKSPDTSSKLSDFIDLHYFNNVSVQRGEIPLASWQEFSVKAPKSAIVMKMDIKCIHNATNYVVDIRQYKNFRTWNTQQVKGSNCFSEEYLENRLLTGLDLCLVRIVHLQCFKSEDNKRMYNYIFDNMNPSSVTLIVQQWMPGIKHNPLTSLSCSNRQLSGRRLSDKVVMSESLRADVGLYTEKFLRSQRYIAVMIRSERVVLSTKGQIDSVIKLKQCIAKTLDIVQSMRKSKNVSVEGTFLTLDFGKFGSLATKWLRLYLNNSTNKDEAFEVIKNIVPAVYGHDFSFNDWENSFAQVSQSINSGYMAAFQRELASRADCLVLVGGGNFQRLAYQGYLENHKHITSHCVNFVCMDFFKH